MSVPELAAHIGADSVEFLTLDGMMRAIGSDAGGYCNACFTGCYPFEVGTRSEKHQFERVLA